MTLTRILVAVGALLVAAWLAVGLRSAVLAERGEDRLLQAVSTPPGPAQASGFAHAARNLDSATALNPDRIPRVLEAQALAGLGEKERARRLTLQLIREEPDNVQLLATARAVALTLGDRRLQAEVVRRTNEVNPRGAVR